MQYTGLCRLVNEDTHVEFLHVADLVDVVDTFTIGETVTFASGAEAVLLDISGNTYTLAVTSVIQPVALDALTGDLSGATASVGSYETAPDLVGFGVTAAAIFLRDGDQIGYVVASIFSRNRIVLGAPYAGPSSDSASGVVHNTRTEFFDLPSFDRRDENLTVLLNELTLRLDNALQDHEARIADMEDWEVLTTCKLRVDDSTSSVEVLYEAQVPDISGSVSIGEALNFPSGVFVTVLAQDGESIIFAVTEGNPPEIGEVFEGGASMVTGTIASYDFEPDMIADGVGNGLHMLRVGTDQVGYRIAAAPTRDRLVLTRVYGGASEPIVEGTIYPTRTPFFELPSFDRRDRHLGPLLNELAYLMDAALKNHEDRITALE